MLALKIGETFLDLNEKTSINLTMNNPIFDRDKIGRSFSYPFNLQATPTNKSVFAHQDRIDTKTDKIRYAASLYIDNVIFEVGEVLLTNSSNKEFKLTFKNLEFALFDELEEVNIRDLAYPEVGIDYDYRPAFVFSVFRPFAADTFTSIQINADIFTVPRGNEEDILVQINAIYPGAAVFSSETGTTYTFILLSTAFDEIPSITLQPSTTNPAVTNYFGLESVDDGSEDAVRASWQTHLIEILQTPETHVFPTIFSPDFFEQETNPEYTTYLNYYGTGGEYLTNTEVHFDFKKSKHSLVPYVFAKTIIQAIQLSGYVSHIESDFLEDTELSQIIVHNNATVDEFLARENYITDDEADSFVNTWASHYALNNHLPDLNAKAFLKKLSSTFCLYFQYENGTLHFKNCKTPLSSKIENWTEKSESAYAQTFSENGGFALDYDRQEETRAIYNQLQKITEGKGKLEIISEWFSMYQLNNFDTFDDTRGSWSLPVINERGTSEAYNIENESSLRLLFYRGLQPDLDDNDYPLATALNINAKNEQVGNLTLNWADDNGLYQNFWKEYLDLINGKTVEKNVRLTIQDLLNLKHFENPRKRINHEKGAMTGVVKSVQFKASMQGIGIAKVTFITE